MTPQSAVTDKKETANVTLVVSRTDDGYRVYSPATPNVWELVTGSQASPQCTCVDFQCEEHPGWRCEHILAVFGEGDKPKAPDQPTPAPKSRRPVTPKVDQRPPANGEPAENGSGAMMLLKRSVSPDGRIDSLSVEFSYPVARTSAKDIKTSALKTLKLQSEIAADFLKQNGNGKSAPTNGDQKPANGNGALPAQMLEIGGLNTKWGRRLFLSFQVNGDTLKLFGNRKRLAEALTAAGQASLAERLEEGLKINAPCLVTTKASGDGQYTNIDQVYPVERHTASKRKP